MGFRDRFSFGLKVETGRLDRARELAVHVADSTGETLPAGHYRVTGGAEDHYVSVPDGRCDCNDWAWNGSEMFCKHLLAVLIHEGRLEP